MQSWWSPAAERNRQPILQVLRRVLRPDSRVLEIGSGTGQHGIWFHRHMPGLYWQTSDRPERLPGLDAGLQKAGVSGLPRPLALDVLENRWPGDQYDAVFAANVAHIISWEGVCAMIEGAVRLLGPGGRLVLYGPFLRGGVHTSEGNLSFDRDLRRRDPAMGLRDIEALDTQAQRHGMHRLAEYAMPSNNLMFVWQR